MAMMVLRPMVVLAMCVDAGAALMVSSTRRSMLASTAAATSVGLFSTPAFCISNGVEREWTLANGVKMPTLALNTAGLTAEGSERATLAALYAGISHVDFHPGVERDGVAKALAASGKRSSLFLTTKIRKPAAGTPPDVAAEAVRTQLADDLAVLGVERVDMLMLRDSPDCAVMQAQWAAMEGVLASGRARSIGVINYCEKSLGCILSTAKTPPAINYIMQHVGMGPDALGLRAYGEKRGVRTFAYGALGEPGPEAELVGSAALRSIGERHGRSFEEVALRWVLQGGSAVSVRPTSDFGLGGSKCAEDGACEAGLRARAQAFDWSLTAEEMAQLDGLRSPAGNPTLFSSLGCPDSYFAAKR